MIPLTLCGLPTGGTYPISAGNSRQECLQLDFPRIHCFQPGRRALEGVSQKEA